MLVLDRLMLDCSVQTWLFPGEITRTGLHVNGEIEVLCSLATHPQLTQRGLLLQAQPDLILIELI